MLLRTLFVTTFHFPIGKLDVLRVAFSKCSRKAATASAG
jgi:hypothetical protein